MANGEGKSLRRQSSWVFGRKGDEFYDAVSAKMTELDLKEGDVLVKEGDNMPGVYMLKTGTLERSKSNGKTGQARTIDSLEPGRITGLLHTLKAGPADKAYATITATTDCKGTPLKGLACTGDSVWPGIGVPAVAASGTLVANDLVSPLRQLLMLRKIDFGI